MGGALDGVVKEDLSEETTFVQSPDASGTSRHLGRCLVGTWGSILALLWGFPSEIPEIPARTGGIQGAVAWVRLRVGDGR